MAHRRRAYVDTSVFGGTEDEEFQDASRRFFAMVRQRRYQVVLSGVTLDELSMGMSGDYEIAIEEGATIVRVGSALFEGVESNP